jgi:hypothetical protein
MNANPKTFVAVKWSDLKTSKDLTGFIEDQLDFAGQTHITKAWLADTLEMLKDLDTGIQDEEDFDPKLTNELAEVAKVVKAKGIQIIVL